MKTEDVPVLLTKEDVCQKLRVSARNLGYMVSQGRFPKGARIGKRLYWGEAAVNRWKALQCTEQMKWGTCVGT
jgi:predicted DNA-binding transcriptional regulator AlpA